jgi:SAM-dependent methyltransferase
VGLPDLRRRAPPSELPELMDGPCSFEEMRGCLRHIAAINRLTLAYGPTLRWLEELIGRVPWEGRPLRILDVGCGYGDGLRRIARWAARRNLDVLLTGIDLNEDAGHPVCRRRRAVSGVGRRGGRGDQFPAHPSS